jgi:hypothetical protein
MGTRKRRERQEQLWVTHTELANGPGHPFYVLLLEQAVGMPIYWPAWKPGWRWSASGAAIPGCAALSPEYRVFARSAARSTGITPEGRH